VCCSVMQCVAVCCSVLQCVAVCCSVLQCVAVCCSVSSTDLYICLLRNLIQGMRAAPAAHDNYRCLDATDDNLSKGSVLLDFLLRRTIDVTFEEFCLRHARRRHVF